MRAIDSQVEVDARAERFYALHGDCAAAISAPASYHVHVDALDYVICASGVLP
jgi:hypothetical protein